MYNLKVTQYVEAFADTRDIEAVCLFDHRSVSVPLKRNGVKNAVAMIERAGLRSAAIYYERLADQAEAKLSGKPAAPTEDAG